MGTFERQPTLTILANEPAHAPCQPPTLSLEDTSFRELFCQCSYLVHQDQRLFLPPISRSTYTEAKDIVLPRKLPANLHRAATAVYSHTDLGHCRFQILPEPRHPDPTSTELFCRVGTATANLDDPRSSNVTSTLLARTHNPASTTSSAAHPLLHILYFIESRGKKYAITPQASIAESSCTSSV